MASVGTIKYKNGSSWIDILHPVNSFYFSYASTSPSSLFGGTWTQITNAVLRAATSTGYTGSDTHKITLSEMPSHNHQIGTDTNPYAYTTSDGDTGSDLSDGAGAGENYKYPRALGTKTNAHAKDTQSTGRGASNVACPAFLQLLYLVQNCVDFLAVM